MALTDWHPTADEVAAIVAEMRPIIRAHAERSSKALRCNRRAHTAACQSSDSPDSPAITTETPR